VTALPVIEHLDIFEDILRGLFTSHVTPMIHELALECPEEAFDTGIIPAVAFAAHARSDAMGGEQVLVPCRGILAAAIGVVQKTRLRLSGRERHEERVLGELPGQALTHRPANHRARVEVEDHCQIEPALCGPDVGDVSGPHSIR